MKLYLPVTEVSQAGCSTYPVTLWAFARQNHLKLEISLLWKSILKILRLLSYLDGHRPTHSSYTLILLTSKSQERYWNYEADDKLMGM